MGLPTLLLNKPVDFLCVFIQCHFQFPIQQILCQFKITPIHRRNFFLPCRTRSSFRSQISLMIPTRRSGSLLVIVQFFRICI